MATNITVSVARYNIENNNLVVFDTRDALQFRDGTFNGAYNVSMYNMGNVLSLINSKILVTGDDVQHTNAIIIQLESLGFKKLYEVNVSIDVLLNKPIKVQINTKAQKKRVSSKMLHSAKTSETSAATVTYKKKRTVCDSTE